jgi:hypothetical protein
MGQLTVEEFAAHTARSRNMHKATVLADSITPEGVRLTTFEWTYPLPIHAEIMTNRMFSRNTASSRAIPVAKMLQSARDNPFFRLHWGAEQSGMQAHAELSEEQKLQTAWEWLDMRDHVVRGVENMVRIGSHKQDANRALAPWSWITAIVSATNFENMFAQRCHKEAEPHYQELSYKVLAAFDASKPRELDWGEWHLPLFGFDGDDEIPEGERPWVSAGRCARVSYLTHHGTRDVSADIKLAHRLGKAHPMHASPLEHAACATSPDEELHYQRSNFHPAWTQLRKLQKGECITKRGEWFGKEDMTF